MRFQGQLQEFKELFYQIYSRSFSRTKVKVYKIQGVFKEVHVGTFSRTF